MLICTSVWYRRKKLLTIFFNICSLPVVLIGDDCIAINGGTSNVNISRITCGPGHGIRYDSPALTFSRKLTIYSLIPFSHGAMYVSEKIQQIRNVTSKLGVCVVALFVAVLGV